MPKKTYLKLMSVPKEGVFTWKLPLKNGVLDSGKNINLTHTLLLDLLLIPFLT
jgi:hypothetical protein